MERCKTCKWWGRLRERVCDRQGDRIATASRETYFSVELAEGEESGYGCEWPELYTGPEFGCVHHEPKEGRNATITVQ